MNVTNEFMKVYKELEMLFDKVYPALKNYPRYEQASTVAQIKEHFHLVMSKALRGAETPTKRRGLVEEITAGVYYLTSLYAFSYRQKFINEPFYMDINQQLNTISHTLHAVRQEVYRK